MQWMWKLCTYIILTLWSSNINTCCCFNCVSVCPSCRRGDTRSSSLQRWSLFLWRSCVRRSTCSWRTWRVCRCPKEVRTSNRSSNAPPWTTPSSTWETRETSCPSLTWCCRSLWRCDWSDKHWKFIVFGGFSFAVQTEHIILFEPSVGVFRLWSWRFRVWSLWLRTGSFTAPWRWREERSYRRTRLKPPDHSEFCSDELMFRYMWQLPFLASSRIIWCFP